MEIGGREIGAGGGTGFAAGAVGAAGGGGVAGPETLSCTLGDSVSGATGMPGRGAGGTGAMTGVGAFAAKLPKSCKVVRKPR